MAGLNTTIITITTIITTIIEIIITEGVGVEAMEGMIEEEAITTTKITS